jgi:hypothetical protein
MEDHDLAIPILPCRSVSTTTEFYRRLGFAVVDPDGNLLRIGQVIERPA